MYNNEFENLFSYQNNPEDDVDINYPDDIFGVKNNNAHFTLFNENNDFDLKMNDFAIEKSETKSNTKVPSPLHDFNVNSNLFNNIIDYFVNNQNRENFNKNIEEKKKIFEIEKHKRQNDKINEEKKSSPVDSDSSKVPSNLSQRMKLKKEKTKQLLREKKNREVDDLNSSSVNSSYNGHSLKTTDAIVKDFVVDNDKIIKLNDKLDSFTKKEIKILRNRISAQKSRDRKREEFDELKEYSANLYNENSNLKKRLEEREKEIINLKKKLCENCKKENINNNNNSTANLNTTVFDLSTAGRRNFNGRVKLGVFTGLILLVFIIATLMWNSLETLNQGPRLLIETISNTSLFSSRSKTETSLVQFNNLTSNNTINTGRQIFAVKNNKNKANVSHPIAVRPSAISPKTNFEYDLLGRKRYEFMLNMANKIRVANSLGKVQKVKAPSEHSYFFSNFALDLNSDDNLNQNISKVDNSKALCLKDSNKIKSNVKDETKKDDETKPKTKEAFRKERLLALPNEIKKEEIKNDLVNVEDLKIINTFDNNVESLLCRDYISNKKNEDNMFENIINKVYTHYLINLQKLDKENEDLEKTDDCLYMHMIIPAKKEEEPNIYRDLEANLNENKKMAYYEIGCKIFEINKIFK